MYGYTVAQGLVHVLKACGDDLTRAKHHEAGGQHQRTWSSAACFRASKVNTSATDFAPISQLQLMKFKGERWDLFGDVHQRRRRRLAIGISDRLITDLTLTPAACPRGFLCSD